MSEFNIEVQGGSSVRLPTAGKYCDRDIVVTASGGGGTEEIENIIDQSGVLGSTDGTATEKVEQLIDKAYWEEVWYKQSEEFANATALFMKLEAKTIPRTNLVSAQHCISLCRDSKIEYIDYYLDTEKCTTFTDGFANTPNLKRMVGVNTAKSTGVIRLFYMSAIEEIDEPLNFSSIFNANHQNSCFYANSLVEIRFVAESIKWSIAFSSALLSAESIQSIIDGLAYVESSQNLTLHKDIILTDNQKQVINAKGWTLIQ